MNELNKTINIMPWAAKNFERDQTISFTEMGPTYTVLWLTKKAKDGSFEIIFENPETKERAYKLVTGPTFFFRHY